MSELPNMVKPCPVLGLLIKMFIKQVRTRILLQNSPKCHFIIIIWKVKFLLLYSVILISKGYLSTLFALNGPLRTTYLC